MGLSTKLTEVRATAPAMRFPAEDIRTRVEVRDDEEGDGLELRVGVAKYGMPERRVRREERV